MNNFVQLVKQYNDIKSRIRRLVLKQQELRELGGLPRTSDFGGLPQQPGYNGSPVEKYIIRLCELEDEQMNLEKQLEIIRIEITKYIDLIPNLTTREIVEYKVFMGKGWRFISHRMNYSVSRVRQLYDEGVAIIHNAGDVNEVRDLRNKPNL